MGNFKIRIPIYSSPHSSSNKKSSKIKAKMPSSQWSDLPPNVVEIIYSFLGRKDQSSMSQVCKNWSREYSSPSLWRHIKFLVPERIVTPNLHPAVRAAQRYGHLFQHVDIVFRKSHFIYILMERTYRQLIVFLQILTKHSQLLSISFINNDYLSRYILGDGRRDLISDLNQTLTALFLTQNQLKSVKFNRMHFVKTFAIELLQTIFASNSATLKNLQFKFSSCDYCRDDSNGATTIDVPLTSKTLMNLESLEIDYSVYFEDIITSIYKDRHELNLPKPGNLQTLVLFCGRLEYRLHNGIEPRAWKYIGTIFPYLKLKVIIAVESVNDMDFYIVRHMPINSLIIKWRPSGVSRLGMTLLHLTKFGINKDLEVLSVQVEAGDNLVEDVSIILRTFPNLSELELQLELKLTKFCYVILPPLTPVFQCFLESGPISLKKLNITIKSYFDSSTVLDYCRKFLDKHVRRLKQVGIIVTVSAIRVPFRLGCLVLY